MLEISLQPVQKQFLKAIDEYDVLAMGGARGGGKSSALRYAHLIRRFKYPGSTGVIFRGTYPELESNHIRPLFTEFPELKKFWNESKKILSLPNGSVQLFRHCGSLNDAHLYHGTEYHDFGYDEAGALDEELFDILRASNRSSKHGIPSRCQLTFNWGSAGHKWLKRRFILKELKENEKRQSYHFIPAKLEDNAALVKSDPDYEHRLMAIGSDALRRAWRWGDHDIEAGQYFSDLRREIHFIEPFQIPEHWNRIVGYDHGWSHPAAMVWGATDEEGTLYIYREFAKSRCSVEEISNHYHSFSDAKLIKTVHAGHDCWVDKGSALRREENPLDPTIAEAFMKNRIYLKPANIDRRQGAEMMREMFRYELNTDEEVIKKKGLFAKKPKVFIFNNCPMVWDSLTRMVHDPDRIEDVLKVDSRDGDPMTGDDLYDCTRYLISSRFGKSPKKENARDRYSLMNRNQQRPNWRTV